jgi:endonuclease/exonuclease/phosphatase family metal-dependent hydrolase
MTFDRVAHRMVFQAGERRFAFVNTHLHHPPEATEERVQQIEYILAWLDRDQRHLPCVIAGDFNSYTGERAVTVMKHRFRSAFEAANGREPDKTWPTPVNDWDPSPEGTLDYIYVSEEFEVADSGLAFEKPSKADKNLYSSDHFGLYARLII